MLGLISVLFAFAAGSDFEDGLNQILSKTARQFEDLQGARIENRMRDYFFQAKAPLPGAAYCRIFEASKGTYAYTCEWKSTSGSIKGSNLYEQLVQKVESCIGPAWAKAQRPRKGGQDTLFRADGKPTVQLIREGPAADVHLFVLPAGSDLKAIGPLPNWNTFFHP